MKQLNRRLGAAPDRALLVSHRVRPRDDVSATVRVGVSPLVDLLEGIAAAGPASR
jgi:hypothetical protein